MAAATVAYGHHEKFNGKGYPRGISGEEIHIYARITAVADVFDALTTSRPYKTAMTREQAIAIIVQGSGQHFDPQIVEVFMLIQDELHRIAAKWTDG